MDYGLTGHDITGAEIPVDGGPTSHGGTKPSVDALTRSSKGS